MGAPIGRSLARDVERALRALLEWRLPPEAWEDTGRLLADLRTAVDQGDEETVDELTARLETNGRRVRRMGDNPEEPATDDGRTPVPPPIREQAVTVLHVVERPSGPGPARDRSAQGGIRPVGT